MKHLILAFMLFFFSACSAPQTPTWLVESQRFIEAFKISKLTSNEQDARELKRYAIASVRQSANIEYLQIIELTDAAMDTALLKDLNLSDYMRLNTIESFPANESYKAMITNRLTESDISHLPTNYQSFARALLSGNTTQMIKTAKEMDNSISTLIALGVITNLMDEEATVYEEILKIGSQNGYRNVIIAAITKLYPIYIKNDYPEKAEKLKRILEEIQRQ